MILVAEDADQEKKGQGLNEEVDGDEELQNGDEEVDSGFLPTLQISTPWKPNNSPTKLAVMKGVRMTEKPLLPLMELPGSSLPVQTLPELEPPDTGQPTAVLPNQNQRVQLLLPPPKPPDSTLPFHGQPTVVLPNQNHRVQLLLPPPKPPDSTLPFHAYYPPSDQSVPFTKETRATTSSKDLILVNSAKDACNKQPPSNHVSGSTNRSPSLDNSTICVPSRDPMKRCHVLFPDWPIIHHQDSLLIHTNVEIQRLPILLNFRKSINVPAVSHSSQEESSHPFDVISKYKAQSQPYIKFWSKFHLQLMLQWPFHASLTHFNVLIPLPHIFCSMGPLIHPFTMQNLCATLNAWVFSATEEKSDKNYWVMMGLDPTKVVVGVVPCKFSKVFPLVVPKPILKATMKAIKRILECIHPLISRILPYMGPILNNSLEQINGLVCGPLDLATMSLKRAPCDVMKATHDVGFYADTRIILQTEISLLVEEFKSCFFISKSIWAVLVVEELKLSDATDMFLLKLPCVERIMLFCSFGMAAMAHFCIAKNTTANNAFAFDPGGIQFRERDSDWLVDIILSSTKEPTCNVSLVLPNGKKMHVYDVRYCVDGNDFWAMPVVEMGMNYGYVSQAQRACIQSSAKSVDLAWRKVVIWEYESKGNCEPFFDMMFWHSSTWRRQWDPGELHSPMAAISYEYHSHEYHWSVLLILHGLLNFVFDRGKWWCNGQVWQLMLQISALRTRLYLKGWVLIETQVTALKEKGI